MATMDIRRFESLSYDDFRQLAKDDTLSPIEKIGFPTSYRKGKEKLILDDISQKLTRLHAPQNTVIDIGPGCSELAHFIIELCAAQKHRLVLLDSAEMLDHLPDGDDIHKLPGYYPECPELFAQYTGKADAVIVYSVFHYIFVEQNYMHFLDKTLELLAPGGQLLIGDIPNQSKRKRFFSSEAGIAFHQQYTQTTETPEIHHNIIEHQKIDDSVIFSMLQRARQAGFDAYVLPQQQDLPMANRREDILITRP